MNTQNATATETSRAIQHTTETQQQKINSALLFLNACAGRGNKIIITEKNAAAILAANN